MSFLNVAVGTDISTVIVDLGIVILLGFIVGRMFEMIRIPAVTGYLVAGLFLGPISGYMSVEYLNHFSVIGDVALGFIAFQVGNELWFGKLKKSGFNHFLSKPILQKDLKLFARKKHFLLINMP